MTRETITKQELKTLINSGLWEQLGLIFSFTPQYLRLNTSFAIDWRSVPQDIYDILQVKNPWASGNKNRPVILGFKIPTARAQTAPQIGIAVRRRQFLFNEQKGICWYCKKEIKYDDWTIEHKTPMSRGGSNKCENTVGACKTCNNTKSNLTHDEFLSIGYLEGHPESNKKRKELITEINKKLNENTCCIQVQVDIVLSTK